jgi:DNA-binding MarR family transcriptional regulator
MRRSDSTSLLPLVVADVFELAGRFRTLGEGIAHRVGQTQARWQVMSAASGGTLTVPQIARRLGVTRQNVQRIANGLVSEGWATFEDNPDHRSSPHLVLNERGRTALAQLAEAALEHHAGLARRLGATGVDELHHGLRRLIAALDDRETSSRGTISKKGAKQCK